MDIVFNGYRIELGNDPDYKMDSVDNNWLYSSIYRDEESLVYRGSQHSVKIYNSDMLITSALLIAVGGGTTIHEHSAILIEDNLLICCANEIFNLSVPSLKLNWMTKADYATCFGIYFNSKGIFVHGEMQVSKISLGGEIIWEQGLRDIIVNIDAKRNEFEMHKNYIDLMDFAGNTYQLGFDGKFIGEQLSEQQKRSDLLSKKRKKWWKFWT